MKQYLKMGEHFSGVVNVDNDGNVSDDKFHRGSLGDFDEKYFEVIAHAINSHDELVQMNQELLAALEGLLDIVGESDGVSGYHLNGDIAEWGEFEELNAAYDAVNKANGGVV